MKTIERTATLLLLLLTIHSSTLFACSPEFYSYFERGGKIYFGIQYLPNNESYKEVKGADKESFKFDVPFGEDSLRSPFYGFDKNAVFYRGLKIKGLDPKSAIFLGGERYLSGSDGYIKDTESVFYLGKKVASVDASSFEAIVPTRVSGGYGKDDNNVFYQGKIIKRDVATFQLLDENYSIDKSGVYFDNELLQGSNPNDFKQNRFYMITGGKIFLNGEQLDGYDVASFEVVKTFTWDDNCGGSSFNTSILKDKNGVYSDKEKLNNVDFKSLEKVNEKIVRDKDGYYIFIETDFLSYDGSHYGFQRIDLDPIKTVVDTIVVDDYRTYYLLKDGKNVFLDVGEKYSSIKNLVADHNIDVASFKLYKIGYRSAIFRDKNHYYEQDWRSFKKIDKWEE